MIFLNILFEYLFAKFQISCFMLSRLMVYWLVLVIIYGRLYNAVIIKGKKVKDSESMCSKKQKNDGFLIYAKKNEGWKYFSFQLVSSTRSNRKFIFTRLPSSLPSIFCSIHMWPLSDVTCPHIAHNFCWHYTFAVFTDDRWSYFL